MCSQGGQIIYVDVASTDSSGQGWFQHWQQQILGSSLIEKHVAGIRLHPSRMKVLYHKKKQRVTTNYMMCDV